MKYLLKINNNTVNESDIKTIEKLPILNQEFPNENYTVQELSYIEIDDESIPLIIVYTQEYFDDGTDEDDYPGRSTTF